MKIQYASDLHLEFESNRVFFKRKPLIPCAPILVLAGDIDVFTNGQIENTELFQYFSDNWEQTYIIPGNHEYYKNGNVAESFSIDVAILQNVSYINNKVITIENVDLIFTTLWSEITTYVEKRIRDFHVCHYNGSNFSADNHNLLHHQAVNFLDHILTLATENKRVVVSHFVPSPLVNAYPTQNTLDSKMISKYFVADLDEYLKKWNIDYWIYGHNHFNNDCKHFNIQFLSNQFGYKQQEECTDFEVDKILIIE